MQFAKLARKLSLNKYDYFSLIYVFLFAIILYIFSNGDIRGTGSDFDLYFDPIQKLLKSNCKNTECFQYLIPQIDNLKVNWIPTPFYSIFFLIPITIFNSDELFLIQGFFITISILFFLRKLIFQFYENKLSNNFLSFSIFLGTLNYAFLKDSLTSGTTSICFLFVLLAFYFRKYFFVTIFMIFLAAITRSNFIFMDISFIIALIIFKPKKYKIYLIYSIIGFFIYLVQYKLFYYSYPQSPIVGIFRTGTNMLVDKNIVEFFNSRLPLDGVDINRWSPDIPEIISVLKNDLSLIYGVIVLYFLKIMNTLGFMSSTFFIDNRGIWLQRLITFFYFLFILAPSFYISCITVIIHRFFKTNFVNHWEIVLLTTSVIYVLLHSLYLGGIRYITGFHFIFIFAFLKFILSCDKTIKYKRLKT